MKDLASFQVYNASAGSGKTFTLVKSYLKIILSTPNTYRFKQILAITFTNKAAQEMKARVLSNLKAISDGAFNDLALQLCEETSISKNQLQQRASLVLNEILNNYSAFSITTIDSFTYKLIKNFAFDLGLSLNFEVELNTKNVLTNAVDLLISKIGKDQNITNVLLLFALFKWQQDETWDVTFALNNIANLLADEDAILEVETLNNKTLTDFSTL
ncbi:MAG: UvrD-helicase domain-containing protein, partial [Zetaproteobacteria bacterium]|nr:UvrD-helicase domain-containing protein [Flavobacteriales bacterium]